MAARPTDHERDPSAQGPRAVAEDKVLVTGLKGPLEEGWQQKVQAFVARLPTAAERHDERAGMPAGTPQQPSAA